MSDFPQLVFSFLLVLGPLVMIHELGHFWFAKRAGIRVLEFGLGFPPRARKLWRGMGKLRIGSTWVHTPRNFKFPAKLADGAVVEARAVEVKGRLMLTSVALIEDENAVTTPLKELAADGIHLRGEISQFDPGTIYSLNWLPIGGFVRMLGEEDPSAPDSFAAAPKRHRAAVLLAGPGMNLVAALVIFCAAYMLGQLVADKISVTIGEVAPGSPAEQAGLVSEMNVLAVESIPVDQPDVLIDYTHAHLGERIELTVRDAAGTLRDVHVFARPDDQRPAGQGPMGIRI
ncbi:MAG: site-2 protease family protein, partial [Longimicrobiales bacterium]